MTARRLLSDRGSPPDLDDALVTMPDTLSLEIPGLTLTALAWGPPGGLPALALHGWLDNAASFSRLAPLLEGVRLVALDLPGHGASGHRAPGVAYHFVDWVADAAAAADALGWERYAVVGHSMGAGIACLLAGTLPQRVTGLALIEGLGPVACAPEEAPARLAKAILRRGRGERRPARVFPDAAAAAARLREANASLSAEAARILVERNLRPEGEGVTWRSDPRLRGLSSFRISEEHVRAFLRRVACPTLVVRALEGYRFDARTAAARLSALRDGPGDLEVAEVSGGHHVHLDHAERVAPALEALLARARRFDPGGLPPAALPSAEPLATPGLTLETLRLLEGIRLVVLDVDGVLTSGALVYGPGGQDRLTFSVRDGLGVKLLLRAGIEVALLSGRAPDTVRARARDLGIARVHLGVDHKLPVLEGLLAELGLEARQAAYMGDDLVDLAPMRAVGYPAAPPDARPEVLAAAWFVPAAPGGAGAVRELAEHILKAQGRWEGVLEGYA